MPMTRQIKCDLSYMHQVTDACLEMRSQEELDAFIEALQSKETSMVHLHSQHRDITLSIYLRFRE